MCCLMRLVSTHVFLSPLVLRWMVPLSWSHSPLESNTRHISESIAASPQQKWPHGRYHPSVTVTSLVVIWPLEIYVRWCPPTICSWRRKTYTCRRLPHIWLKVSILLYTPRALSGLFSTETHTRTSSSSILVKDRKVSRHVEADFWKRNWGWHETKIFKMFPKALRRGLDEIVFLDSFCTPHMFKIVIYSCTWS